MNLADNLKKIRKENNLSQEQLADQLGVSRQSVSKWESNQAYPEMDKVLQICKMFNLNIDELLNQNIEEVNENKQTKNNINKFIDDFLDYITKTIDMFTSMSFKQKVKCLFEQLIILLIIIVALSIIGTFLSNIVTNILYALFNDINWRIYNILESIYLSLCLIITIILILHIFKVRYLDYYQIIKTKEEPISNEKDISKTEDNSKKIILEKQPEKIIIRDPNHSGYKFISGMLKLLLIMLKCFIAFIDITFCFSLITLVMLFIISFLFIKTGLLFIGTIFILLASIIINLIILIILYNFIISKKTKKKRLSLFFIISLIMIGIGSGLICVALTEFTYIDNLDNKNYIESTKTIPMNDNSYLLHVSDEDYIESDNTDIKIVYKHSKLIDLTIWQEDNGYIDYYFESIYNDPFEIARTYIKDINNKEFIDYDNFDIKIYTSKENIEKLKENTTKHILNNY